jgi:hypothetical protein
LIKKNLYVWACDLSPSTGEGNLGKLYIDQKLKDKFSIKKIKSNNIKFLNHKYISPFIGIFYCWLYYFKKRQVCYLNYLPLWNLAIFTLLPPKTIMGPITGGSKFKKDNSFNYILRKFVFPILYKFSAFILTFRNQKLYFSTELLRKYFKKINEDKLEFNFILKAINPVIKINKNRSIDFIIYFKNHKNKKKMYPFDLLKKLILYNFKVYVVGDYLDINGITNLGYLNKNNLKKYLTKTKFSIISTENIFSFFSIECINEGVKIISNIKKKEINKKIQRYFIHFNTDKFFEKNKIKKLINFN